MKSTNRTLLFFKIWGVHLLAFYIPFGLLFKGVDEIRRGINVNFIELIILSSFIGLSGFDGFLLYLSMISMGFVLLFTNGFFKAYYLSVLLIGFGVLLILVIIYFKYILEGNQDRILYIMKHIAWILPSSFIAITINWLVFRKTYKRLKVENLQSIIKKSTDDYDGNEEE